MLSRECSDPYATCTQAAPLPAPHTRRLSQVSSAQEDGDVKVTVKATSPTVPPTPQGALTSAPAPLTLPTTVSALQRSSRTSCPRSPHPVSS